MEWAPPERYQKRTGLRAFFVKPRLTHCIAATMGLSYRQHLQLLTAAKTEAGLLANYSNLSYRPHAEELFQATKSDENLAAAWAKDLAEHTRKFNNVDSVKFLEEAMPWEAMAVARPTLTQSMRECLLSTIAAAELAEKTKIEDDICVMRMYESVEQNTC